MVCVKFVIMAKRLNMLHYILNESTSSTFNQVYEVLKGESRKRDFYNLNQKDFKNLNIKLNEEQIKEYSKTKGKTYVKNVMKQCAFNISFLKIPNLKTQKK